MQHMCLTERLRQQQGRADLEVKGKTTGSDGGAAARGRAPDVQQDSHGHSDCAEIQK